jgi:arylsulfatase A-like enzyme
VHAGAVVYMKNNPNSELTNRVKELYKLALDNVPHAPDTYWAQNVDEFLAETLTNPAIIKSMNAVRVPGKSINTTIMTDLLNTVLAMLGLKKESTIYQETLNSYAGILEQVAYTKVGADLEDVVHKAVDSLKMKQLLLQGMKDC